MKEYEDINWWHQVDLPDGRRTPGVQDCDANTRVWLVKPRDFRDKDVLDIGSWDGGYCFLYEKWGAKYVLATDSVVWDEIGSDGIDYCLLHLGSKVEKMYCKTFDISPENVGMYDVVMFCGVFYHLRNPLISTDRAISVVNPGGMLCLETHINEADNNPDIPQMVYYPSTELNDDPTNWVGPNNAMMYSLLTPYFDKVTHKNWGPEGGVRGFFRCEGRNDVQPNFNYW